MRSISIVFPVYNEIDNLEKLLTDWGQELANHKLEYEFVIVEDGSTDGTKELIKKLEQTHNIVNLSQDQRRGYTRAVVDGIYGATKEHILCTDSDNQIRVESLIENIKIVLKKDEFLFGYRNPRKDPLNRIVYSKLFKILHDLLFNSKLKDPSCPFVVGLTDTYKKLDKQKLLLMKEGFWWGFVGVCKLDRFFFREVPIKHYPREKGEAGYKIRDLFGIILRNVKGLFKIKFS